MTSGYSNLHNRTVRKSLRGWGILAVITLVFWISGFRRVSFQFIQELNSSEPAEFQLTLETSSADMSGYADKISVFPGDTLRFMTSTSAATFSLTLKRFGKETRTMLEIAEIAGEEQAVPDSAWKYGCGWTPTFEMVIPDSYSTGLYSALLRDANNKAMWVTFIVKPRQKGRTRIAVLASTHTWQAYNAWGGKSFYVPAKNYARFLSYLRPNPRAAPVGTGINHLTRAEIWILQWLESNGYDYDLYSDIDLHADPTLLEAYDTVILNTHPEYWTGAMLDHLEAFLDHGGKLLYLGGNGLYWKVTLDSTLTVMECRKDGGIHAQTGEAGGLWQNLGRPQAKILGVRYTSAGYNTWWYYTVKNAEHWIFRGTGYKNGDIFGALGFNGGGASGWETDKIDSLHSPANVVLLARGANPDGGGADMVYYDHPGGGYVFSVGSISFGGTLRRMDGKYLKITQFVRNALDGKITGIASPPPPKPQSVQLLPNYPNPFNPQTIISFHLSRPDWVVLTIYNARGQKVAQPLQGRRIAGLHQIQIDARSWAAGLYLYELKTSDHRTIRKMLLIK